MIEIKITHVFHNCFVLKAPGIVLLFDVPAARFRRKSQLEALERAIHGEDVIAFISHSHTDHFDSELRKTCSCAASLKIIVADDVVDMFPEFNGSDLFIVEPDKDYLYSGLKIETLMSNDLGVAFIIHLANGLTVYFGGDLARWDWEEAPAAQREFAASFFKNALRRIAAHKIDIAFSNVDKRLKSLAGAPDFVRAVNPGVFIPTHAFGRTSWLEGINEKLGLEAEHCFIYRKAGDTGIFYLDI